MVPEWSFPPAACDAPPHATGVLAQWQVNGGRSLVQPPGTNLAPRSGVRRDGAVVQMGLTRREIEGVWDRTTRLVKMIDKGEIVAF